MGLPLEMEGVQLPEKRLSMRKIKEVLRLRHELGLHQEQIARRVEFSLEARSIIRYWQSTRLIPNQHNARAEAE
jgi:hypothetical protein